MNENTSTSTQTPVLTEKDEAGTDHGGAFQVVLHNDDVNPVLYVVGRLMSVFGHPRPLAWKIMMEAHTTGRAIAQVEPEEPARRHAAQLAAAHLRATVEPVG